MLQQEYDMYTKEDHHVWSLLFERQIDSLSSHSAAEYMTGVKNVQFTKESIPDFRIVNKILHDETGWELFPVPGIMPNKEFFELLSAKKFPATTWIRKIEQLDYLEEPDMFHDVFGHVPLLSNEKYCSFLLSLSNVALDHIDSPDIIELIGRVYWFTVEFGLINTGDELKIYGAGLASSIGETKHSLSDSTLKLPFNVTEIINTPYRNDIFQEKYFVIDSFDQLYHCIPDLKKALEAVTAE